MNSEDKKSLNFFVDQKSLDVITKALNMLLPLVGYCIESKDGEILDLKKVKNELKKDKIDEIIRKITDVNRVIEAGDAQENRHFYNFCDLKILNRINFNHVPSNIRYNK